MFQKSQPGNVVRIICCIISAIWLDQPFTGRKLFEISLAVLCPLLL